MEVSEVTNELVESVVAASGHVVVRSDDPETVAELAAERLGAELVFGVDELEAAIAERLAGMARRTAASEALELDSELGDPSAFDHEIVADVASLRTLVARLDAAQHLVSSTRDDMRDRVGEATGLAIHPDTIRAAATEVTASRAAAEALRAEVEAAEAEWRTGIGSFGPDDDLAGLDQFGADPDDEDADWEGGATKSLVAAGLVLLGSIFVAAAGFGPAGPAILALPVLALLYAISTLMRTRGDAEGRDLASENLATMSAMTDMAYGGAIEPTAPPAVHALQLQHDAALDRVRYAENAWRGLVGPGVEVDALDEVLQTRDPRVRVADPELDRTPAVRTALRHVRRLHARWKLTWWALDRPIPALAEAGGAIDALEAEGITAIPALTYEGRQAQTECRERFDELRSGRDVEALRSEVDFVPSPLVALDPERAIDEEGLLERASSLGGDARVVVVAPDGSDA